MPTRQTDRRTEGWTPDRYITLSPRCGQRSKRIARILVVEIRLLVRVKIPSTIYIHHLNKPNGPSYLKMYKLQDWLEHPVAQIAYRAYLTVSIQLYLRLRTLIWKNHSFFNNCCDKQHHLNIIKLSVPC